jgi:hypothetical protein
VSNLNGIFSKNNANEKFLKLKTTGSNVNAYWLLKKETTQFKPVDTIIILHLFSENIPVVEA